LRIESRRTLELPLPPAKAWQALSSPSGLTWFAPEIDSARQARDGRLRLSAWLGGRRRRSWWVWQEKSEPGRRWSLTSATPGLDFHFEAVLEPSPSGCSVRIELRLEPPPSWEVNPSRSPAPRKALRQLVIASVLFGVSALGLLFLPALGMPKPLAALAWAMLGACFVAAVALLSGTHARLRRVRGGGS
jgi:nitrate reductase gamma subunit